MIERSIDTSQNTLKNVYSIHPGKKITPYNSEILTDEDYIIISCSNMQLVERYFDTEKRVYVLLDKMIMDNEYINKKLPNVWFIKTNLRLPNILLTENTLYLLTFNLIQDKPMIFKQVKQYFKSLIIKNVQNQKGFDFDLIEEKFSTISRHENYDAVVKVSDYIISDVYEGPSILCSINKNQLDRPYKQLDTHILDPLSSVFNNTIKIFVIHDTHFDEIHTNIVFNIEEYSYRELHPKVTYKETKDQLYYDIKGNKVNIKSEIEIRSIIHVDFVRKHHKSFIENHIEQFIKKTEVQEPALSVSFKFTIKDYVIEDFTINKKLSENRVKEILNITELDQNIDIYDTKEGLVAVIDYYDKDLLIEQKVKFLILRKEL